MTQKNILNSDFLTSEVKEWGRRHQTRQFELSSVGMPRTRSVTLPPLLQAVHLFSNLVLLQKQSSQRYLSPRILKGNQVTEDDGRPF